ncbi:hypothetical protein EIP86_010089 [Pleurotus ostreatoroseus]|nr:hypothetical protein EIP86_010089 [Pleurotus ostreatoroseus]
MASSAALTTKHLPQLRTQLEEWRQKQRAPSGFKTPLSDITTHALQGNGELRGKDVIVAFRTRPPLPDEAAEKFQAYEAKDEPSSDTQVSEGASEGVPAVEHTRAEFCAGVTVTDAEPGTFVAHVPGYKWSGPTLTHKAFSSDVAFGPDVDNEEVYQRAVVAHDMIKLALSQGTACILAYGQTGSGKTFTMEGLEYRVARDLFATADRVAARLAKLSADEQKPAGSSEAAAAKCNDVFEFSVTFLELLGKRAVDLLEPGEGLPLDMSGNPIRKEVTINEDKASTLSDSLYWYLRIDTLPRRVSATLRNAASSRSHALLTIKIKNKLLPYAEEGQIILVDLAGSERYEDSKAHDKQRMLESRENNNSLMNLKECVRAKAKMANEDGFVHIPWRGNKLTMLLKPIFDPENRKLTKTLIIAHVSPHIQDATHSVNTLSYAAPFKMAPPKPRGPAPYNPGDPRTWNHAQTKKWLTDEFTKRAKARQGNAQKDQDAARKGLKMRSGATDKATTVEPLVDVDQLCPGGMTAKNYGAMYTTEFIQRCLEARNVDNKDARPEVVGNVAGDIIASLTYLIVTAKTKGRKEIMKSRKKLTIEAYGETPFETIPGPNEQMPELTIPMCHALAVFTHDEFRAAAAAYGALWHKRTDEAVAKAKEEGADVEEARIMSFIELMDDWKSGKTKSGDGAGKIAA